MNVNCVICSDLFVSADSIFSTPCGHIFHHACLLQWIEKSKTCPQCRRKTTERSLIRVYFNHVSSEDPSENSTTLMDKLDKMILTLHQKDAQIKKAENEKLSLESEIEKLKKKIDKTSAELTTSSKMVAIMKHENDMLSISKNSYKELERDNKLLKEKVTSMQCMEAVLLASQKDCEDIIKQNLDIRTLSVMVGTLKRELESSENRKNEFRRQNQHLKNELRVQREEKRVVEERLSVFESENHILNQRIIKLSKHQASEVILLSPEKMAKKPRIDNLIMENNFENTPSPLSTSDFNNRVEKIRDSESPYLQIKSSGISMSLFKKASNDIGSGSVKAISSQTKTLTLAQKPGLSIFNKKKLSPMKALSQRPKYIYNGLGSSDRLLESDFLTTKRPMLKSIKLRK